MLRVSSVHCTSAVQEFLQTSRCTIAVNACQVSEAAEGSQGRLLLHIEWPTVANTTVYLLEMDLTSLETDFILPEMDFNSPEMDFTSLETDFTSPETDFTFFIFEVHFRWVKSIFNGYLQMDLTFSKHSIFDRLHPSEVYYDKPIILLLIFFCNLWISPNFGKLIKLLLMFSMYEFCPTLVNW